MNPATKLQCGEWKSETCSRQGVTSTQILGRDEDKVFPKPKAKLAPLLPGVAFVGGATRFA